MLKESTNEMIEEQLNKLAADSKNNYKTGSIDTYLETMDGVVNVETRPLYV